MRLLCLLVLLFLDSCAVDALSPSSPPEFPTPKTDERTDNEHLNYRAHIARAKRSFDGDFEDEDSPQLDLFDRIDRLDRNIGEMVRLSRVISNLIPLSETPQAYDSNVRRGYAELRPALFGQFKDYAGRYLQYDLAAAALHYSGYNEKVTWKHHKLSAALSNALGYQDFDRLLFVQEGGYDKCEQVENVLNDLELMLKTGCKFPSKEDSAQYAHLLDIIEDRKNELGVVTSFEDGKLKVDYSEKVIKARFLNSNATERNGIIRKLQTTEGARALLRNGSDLNTAERTGADLCFLGLAMVEMKHDRLRFSDTIFQIIDDLAMTATLQMNCRAIKLPLPTPEDRDALVKEVVAKVKSILAFMREWTAKRMEYAWPEVMLKETEKELTEGGEIHHSLYNFTAKKVQHALERRGLKGIKYQVLVHESSLSSDADFASLPETKAILNHGNFSISGVTVHIFRLNKTGYKQMKNATWWKENEAAMRQQLGDGVTNSSCHSTLSALEKDFKLLGPGKFSGLLLLKKRALMASNIEIPVGIVNIELESDGKIWAAPLRLEYHYHTANPFSYDSRIRLFAFV